MPRESAGVDGGLSSRVERGSKPLRGAIGSQAMVASRLPTPEDSVRFVGDPPRGCAEGCARALQACVPGALPGFSTTALARWSTRPLVWGSFGFDSRRELFARGGVLVPVGANAQRGPGSGGRVSAAQGGRVSAAVKSNFATTVFPVLIYLMCYINHMKREEQERVVRLRKQGLSLRTIAEMVPVSRASISKWTRGIRLSDQQIAQMNDKAARGRERWARAMSKKREERWTLFHCDPGVHRAFVRFLQLLGYDSTRLSVALYLHRGDDSDAARKFWAEAIRVPSAQFTRDVFVAPRSASAKRVRMQPNGTCRIRVRGSTELAIKMRAWMSLALSEHGRVAEAPLFQSG